MILIRNPCSTGVHALKTDYTVASLAPLLSSSHIDAVVSTLHGPALEEAQIALIDAAKAAKVKRLFHLNLVQIRRTQKCWRYLGCSQKRNRL